MKRTLPNVPLSRTCLPAWIGLALLLGIGFLTLTAPRCLADRATYDPTKTWDAFPLSTPPVIDGVITDEEWLPINCIGQTTVNPLLPMASKGAR